jgi:integrase
MAKKRGNGEGSITKRKDGRYMARYTVHTTKGPKRRTVYGRTRKEAADKLAKALSDRVEGIVYDDENMTVGNTSTCSSRARCAAPSGKAPTIEMPAS